MAKAKPKDITTIAREIISHGGHEIPYNEIETLQFCTGGINLKIHFETSAQGFPLKLAIDVTDKIQTDVSVDLIEGVPTKIVGPNSRTKEQKRILLKDQPLSTENPIVHIFDRSGNTGFNLVIETSQANNESIDIKFLLVARPNDDKIMSMPVLSGLQNTVPQFAQRHPECFPKKDLLI